MYRLNKEELDNLSTKIAQVLIEVPVEDRESVITQALSQAQKIRARRFANQLVVNEYLANRRGSTDPYWYVHWLLTEGRRQLHEGNVRDLLLYMLYEHNHGHSGWVEDVNLIYRTPHNEEERQVAEKLWRLIHDTLEKMLEAPLPTRSVDNIMNLHVAVELFNRLGRDAPIKLRQKLEAQLERNYKAGE